MVIIYLILYYLIIDLSTFLITLFLEGRKEGNA